MRACHHLGVMLALAMLVASPSGAGPRIATPRALNPRFDPPDSLRMRRLELGFGVGTPAGVDLDAGYWFDRTWGVRASGMYLGFWGIQGNLCATLARARRTRIALTALAGTFRAGTSDYLDYAGPGVDLYLGGFFLEAAIVGYGGTISPGGRAGGSGIVGQVGLIGGGGVFGPR